MSFDSIEYSSISEEDIQGRARARTLSQFWNSEVFQSVLQATISEVKALQLVNKGMIELRGPADATGEQLQVLGRITGQSNYLATYAYDGVSIPDAPGSYANDSWYRDLIETRILRNFNRFSSVYEIQEAIQTAFEIDISFFQSTELMCVDLVLSTSVPNYYISFLTTFVDSDRAVDEPFISYPATLSLKRIWWLLPDVNFTPDVSGCECDVAPVTVLQTI